MLSIFMKKLTVNEAKNKVTTSDNAVLIDCRPKEDYAHGHVAGAINFPIEKITERLKPRMRINVAKASLCSA